METSTPQPSATFLRRAFLPFLDFVVAVDRPRSMMFVNRRMAATWNVAADQVFAAAEAKLAVLADAKVELYDDINGPLFVVATGDDYETSRLLVPGWLESFRGRVEGRPIAIIPERTTLMVGGDRRPEMVNRLAEKAEREFAASSRRLSPGLYTSDESGRVIPYCAREGDPFAAKVRVGHEKLALREYEYQWLVLDKFYENTGKDIFVASYTVVNTPSGAIESLSVWSEGVLTHLPRSQRVVLHVPGAGRGAKPKRFLNVPFESIEDRVRPVPDLHPPRFETVTFPSEPELEALEIARS